MWYIYLYLIILSIIAFCEGHNNQSVIHGRLAGRQTDGQRVIQFPPPATYVLKMAFQLLKTYEVVI